MVNEQTEQTEKKYKDKKVKSSGGCSSIETDWD